MIIHQSSGIKLLLECLNSDDHVFKHFYRKAEYYTNKYFGRKRTLFNPLYVSDICLADCPYCGFKVSNKGTERKTLTPSEAVQEATFLKQRGVGNILVLAGDYKHSKYVEMLSVNISAIKKEVQPKWIGVEIATLEIAEYRKLIEAGAQSVTVFQETYNRERYSTLHENPVYKGDFDFRFNAQERAVHAGFKEVGFGVLYGVGFWKADTVSMAEHALNIKNKFPKVKLRFSFPRLQDSDGQSEDCRAEEVSEKELLKAIVGIRLTFPEASLVLTGRETKEFLCVNSSVVDILGYKGSTVVGGYSLAQNGRAQFSLANTLPFLDFSKQLITYGYNF